MKRMIVLTLGLACLGIGFDAAADERLQVSEIAQEAGVSPDQVRMVLGSRTQFAAYRTSYDRVEKKVAAATARLLAQRIGNAGHRVAAAASKPAAPVALASH